MRSQCLTGRVSVVTGGSSGIGEAICERLGRVAARVVVVGRNEQRCGDVAEKINVAGGQAKAMPTDITQPAAVADLFENVRDLFGRVDILVNNAGLYCNKRLLDITDDDWFGVLESSLTGAFLCAREAYRLMKPAGHGHVVTVASQAAGWPGPEEISYGSVKTAQVKFMLHLRMEFDKAQAEAAEAGQEAAFFAHTICPGAVDTPLQRNLGRPEKLLAQFLRAGDVADLTMEVLRNPGRDGEFFRQWAESRTGGKPFHVGPQGWFEQHPTVMRIWRD
jgi:NAD(P)-dependent dehydrogenase (short-subunit alcohol dehydrogenase family)